MAIRQINKLPDPVLRQKAHKVKNFGGDLNKLVVDMIDTMRDEPGVGLAASQVGVSQQVVVVEFGDEEDETIPKKLYVVVNPQIVKASPEKINAVEACLSIPGLVGDVERHVQILIKGQDKYGKPLKIKASDWLARIFQHEIDHLDGVLYTDRAASVWQPKEDEELEVVE